jgi:biotin--protein ligase
MLKRINVLIYNGAGTSPQAIRQATATLRQHLSPYYAVSTLAATQLLKEPWPSSCALLVIPGGADTNYCRELNGLGTHRIRAYVEAGGKLMGFCAGGYFSSARCEFEVGREGWEVAGPRELALFPGICRGLAFSGFVYGSEAGARAVRLDVESTAFTSPDGTDEMATSLYSYYNGGGIFVDADKLASEGVEILARFVDPIEVDAGDNDIRAAIVHCRVGQGAAILTGPHPEYDRCEHFLTAQY